MFVLDSQGVPNYILNRKPQQFIYDSIVSVHIWSGKYCAPLATSRVTSLCSLDIALRKGTVSMIWLKRWCNYDNSWLKWIIRVLSDKNSIDRPGYCENNYGNRDNIVSLRSHSRVSMYFLPTRRARHILRACGRVYFHKYMSYWVSLCLSVPPLPTGVHFSLIAI